MIKNQQLMGTPHSSTGAQRVSITVEDTISLLLAEIRCHEETERVLISVAVTQQWEGQAQGTEHSEFET